MELDWTKCRLFQESKLTFWCDLDVDLSYAKVAGVYVVWADHRDKDNRLDRRAIRVGQGDIQDRIQEHRNDKKITRYSRLGKLKVTWAKVDKASLDGVERYLGDYYRPLEGKRFPDVLPIRVNLPWRRTKASS